MKAVYTAPLLLFAFFISACSYLPEEIELIAGVELNENSKYIKLSPKNTTQKSTGIFFYPGGLVDYHAYIPLWQRLSAEGYLVLILKVNANLAIMNGNKTAPLLDDFAGIDRWLVAGHSLGGIKASIDVGAAPEKYTGMIFMGSYPFNLELQDWDGSVLSLYGEFDELLDNEELENAKDLVPPALIVDSLSQMPSSSTSNQSIYHEIKGGNHAYFGNYGAQDGDGAATISRTEQQELVIDFILAFLNANNWN